MAEESGGSVRIELALEPGSDPICGELAHGAEPSRPFRGWLQLIARIEAAAGLAPEPAAPGEEPGI